jgi:hypothetical protein
MAGTLPMCIYFLFWRRWAVRTAQSAKDKRRPTSDFKYSDCQRMLRPIQFTVLELNYNFQMLTIQIRFYNSEAKALVHILILSCLAFYFALVTIERS